MYYIYILRCKDDSLYTGITTDVKRRFYEHLEKTEKCAKYTSTHSVVKIEKVWETETRSLASKLEYNIKKNLTKIQKEDLIKNKYSIKDLLNDRIDYELYKDYKVK